MAKQRGYIGGQSRLPTGRRLPTIEAVTVKCVFLYGVRNITLYTNPGWYATHGRIADLTNALNPSEMTLAWEAQQRLGQPPVSNRSCARVLSDA